MALLALTLAPSLVAPAVTSRAKLTFAIGDSPVQPLVVGLYGTAAPKSVALFEDLCTGTLGGGLRYAGSSVSRIERDKLIVGGSLAGGSYSSIDRTIDRTGYVRSKVVSRAEDFLNDDMNGLSHDRPGLLSMRRGGGAFEFVLTPAANPALDAERIVIGEIENESGE
jgi:cyclophilin family peptidyl-prolyl cis-trans isomerase